MRKSNSYKLSILAVFCLYSSAAFAQKENMDTLFDLPHLMAYLVAGLLISVFVMVFYNRVFYYREREVNKQSERLNEQLTLVMDSNKTQVWTYDKARNIFRRISDQGNSTTGIAPIDFSQAYDRDDFLEMRSKVTAILERETLSESLFMRSPAPKSPDEQQHIYEVNLSILNRNRHNVPTVILGVQSDITDEKLRTDKALKLMLRYHTVFNSSLVDMFYYDANGLLTDINEKACETFHIRSREEALAKKVHFNDIPAFRDIDLQHVEGMQASSETSSTELKKIGLLPKDAPDDKNFYYECAVSPLLDQDGRLLGIFAAGRNVTDMVESNHHQKESTRLLEQTTRNIQSYIDNINFSLKVSDVRLMNYYPDTHELVILSDLSQTLYELPQLRAITMIRESDRRRAKGLFRRMDRRHPGVINETLRTLMRDAMGRDVYLNFNVMPIYNEEGVLTHYFGMCRNETEMTYTEMKMREETEKAQETEQLKNLFLFNMSYELRTPLSAVIGFAELFNGEHSEEDEPIFAEEIRTNTGNLLKLINDILFISRLDAHMVEFNYLEEDFAALFDGWCYMGWSTVDPSIKVVVENPYSHLLARIDNQNLSMVIEKLCLFSASTVSEGMVRAKYEYRRGELMITIEDTGRGIASGDLPKVFDRFVHDENNNHFGTGLDLPIVKELVEQMNGNIEIQSEQGKGTTIFVSIPCQISAIEKKSEIMV